MSESAEHAFRRHYRDVYGFVRRRTASADEAEEITAEVFEAAVAGLDRFERGRLQEMRLSRALDRLRADLEGADR